MPYNLLIVDDSKLARMAVAKALKSREAEWNRVEAANADEALAALKAGKIDIAMLDFNMPGRDGLSLAAEMRLASPDMPVAIISANYQQEIVQRAKDIGAVFMAKPVTEDVLLQFLDGAVQQIKAGGAAGEK
jgi:DNA-binding NarL/FixJ family response regulator